MLSRDYDGFDANWFLSVIFHGDLALAVWSQPVHNALLANFCQAIDQAVSVGDWHRHQFFSLITRVAKHQALVASTVTVNTLSDVAALAVKSQKDSAAVSVKADVI